MTRAKYLWLLLLVAFCSHLLGNDAHGCAACVAAGKLARESENRPFYALRILYENEKTSSQRNANPFCKVYSRSPVVGFRICGS